MRFFFREFPFGGLPFFGLSCQFFFGLLFCCLLHFGGLFFFGGLLFGGLLFFGGLRFRGDPQHVFFCAFGLEGGDPVGGADAGGAVVAGGGVADRRALAAVERGERAASSRCSRPRGRPRRSGRCPPR